MYCVERYCLLAEASPNEKAAKYHYLKAFRLSDGAII